jgi:diguanylate cyclase (GGDEF)-like protein
MQEFPVPPMAPRVTERVDNNHARFDPLTEFGTRFAFDEAVGREVSRTRRSGAALSLLILDVDDLKSVNESQGRHWGDQLLRAIAGIITAQVRLPDLCFRFGGDEFVLLLPETSHPGAMELARRIRGICAAEHRLHGGQPLRLTAGIAQLGPDQDGAGLLDAAGRDLRRAKQASAQPAPETPPG